MLAQGLSQIDGILVDPETIETDIVYFELTRADLTTAQLSAGLKELGVLVNPTNKTHLRAVTNFSVTSDDIERTLDAFARVFQSQDHGSGDGVRVYG